MWEIFRDAFIIVFCFWHCAAIVLYLQTPQTSSDRSNPTIKTGSIVSPYVLSVSQWQGWDFYAPFPVNHSSRYRIERLLSREWIPVQDLDALYIHTLRRPKEFALLHSLEEGFQQLIPSYLQDACRSHQLEAGTSVRLSATYFIIPKSLSSLRHVDTLTLTRLNAVLGTTTCSSS